MEQLKKPGVDITQVVSGTAPNVSTPSLVPCIVGPAFEVVELLSNDGTPNSQALLLNDVNPDLYEQVPKQIDVTSFPTPHADPLQMSVLSSEVNVGLFSGKSFKQLDVRPGSAFLAFANVANRAGILLKSIPNNNKLKLNIAIDQRNPEYASSDVFVDISGTSLDDLVNKLNSALLPINGTAVKHEISTGVYGILIRSNAFGASSSVTLRHKSNGNSADHSSLGLNDSLTYRVTGSGLKAEDNPLSGVTTSAYIQHAVEKSEQWDTKYSEAVEMNDTDIIGVWTNEAGDKTSTKTTQLEFTGSGSSVIPLKAAGLKNDGDLLYTSGLTENVVGVQIIQVEQKRFKLGTVNSVRSVYDSKGNPISQRYDDYVVHELEQPLFFAPKYAYFIANNITASDTNAQPGSVEGTYSNTAGYIAPEAASVTFYAAFPLSGTVGNTLNITTSFDDGVNVTTTEDIITIASDYEDVDTLVSELTSLVSGATITKVNSVSFSISNKLNGVKGSISVTGSYLTSFEDDAGNPLTSPQTGVGTDEAITGISGLTISLKFNGSDKTKDILATSDSIFELVDKINEVCLNNVCEISGTGTRKIKFTSYITGRGSSVVVNKSNLAKKLGFSDSSDTEGVGQGRPDADLSVANDGSITLGGDIIRLPSNGKPIALSTGASIYIEYRALRLDLSAVANNPGLVKVSSITDLISTYGPVSARNPLALGLYYAMVNAGDGVEVTGLGISDVSEAEPSGTAVAYLEAADLIKSHEVYAVVPLSQSEQVIEIFDKHVKDMSSPALRGERILISAPQNPDRRNSTVVLSGDTAESTGNTDQIDLNDTPEVALSGLGVDTSGIIPFELLNGQQLYVSITFGDIYRNYSVQSVDGARILIRRSLTESQMADGFYSTESLPSSFSSATFSLQLRGTKLTIAGSNRLDKSAYAKTIRDRAQQYQNRRQLRLYPDKVVGVISGVTTELPSFYFACALSGACSSVSPQEPFTRRRMIGFTDVKEKERLENSHYDIISAGNAVIEVESAGESPALRMQATTDITSIESREWSITKAVDFFSKVLRNALRRRVGLFNITQAYIDDLSTLLDGACNSAINAGLFKSASVDKLEQDKNQPDTLLVTLRLEVLYPANYIQLTIVI